jgi:folate-binding protein YgfZ
MLRPSRALFRFSGPEAQRLLFDVVTARVTAESGPAVWWALLSPQGKIQAEGLCGWAEDAFWLDVDSGVADTFLKRMRMYKLRAAMEIEDLRETHVVGWSPEAEGTTAHADPRRGQLGYRVIAERAAAADWWGEGPDFTRARIAAGIAELGPDFEADTSFPHDIGMDLLDGVDFKKGCYVGQEVVSRMQHRGTARRRPVIVSALPDGAAAGAPLMVGEREIGTIGTMLEGKAVAIVRLDRVPHGEAATFANLPVMLHLPEWATYEFGESAGAD